LSVIGGATGLISRNQGNFRYNIRPDNIPLSPRTPDRDNSLALLQLVSRHLHHSPAALDPTTAPIEIILACLDAFADKSFSLPFQRKYAIRLRTMTFQNFVALVSMEYDQLIQTRTNDTG